MSDDTDHLLSDESRRSFMKKGALASGALALGATGGVAAQEGDDGALGGGQKALIFVDNFHPFAQFTFVSGVVDWVPNYAGVRANDLSNYQTWMIRWLNTGNVVPLFVAQDAEVGQFDQELGFVVDADDDPNQPQVYEMNREFAPFGDNPRLLTVNFSPVGEEEEDDVLDDDEWWRDGANGGE